jgi:hypothetical protein
MEAIWSGKAADAIVSFYPTSAYIGRPSYMELSMTETLFSGFREAVLFIFPFESRRKFGKFFDVAHTVIEVLHAFDSSTSATASEKYFGFQRVRRDKGPLSSFQRLATVFESLALRHLISRTSSETVWEQKLARCLKLTRAILASLYIVGLSETVSPIQLLLGIRVARAVPTINDSRKSHATKIFSALVWCLIFGFQLTQWYFSHEQVLNQSAKPTQCMPPSNLTSAGLPADFSICPICFKTRSNPAVLIATGHVYCYACIWKSLSDRGSVCPITGKALPPTSNLVHYIRRLV